MRSEVAINGHYLGKFYNGYLGFCYDITDFLTNGENVLAVRFINEVNSSRWYTGNGIYRNVYLSVRNPYFIDDVFVYTPNTNTVKVEITADTQMVSTTIINPNGKIVGQANGKSPEFHIENPMLWDINKPLQYKAVTKAYDENGEVKYLKTTKFGIRSIELSADHGLILNGRKVFLKGVNLHHDLGALGSASFVRGYERRLENLKSLGVNAIRTAHNPYSVEFLELCDEMGFLVFAEAFDKWNTKNKQMQYDQFYLPDSTFSEHWEEDLINFIKRDRNHPSIFIWSVGNETFNQIFCEDDCEERTQEKMDVVKKYDFTRPVTVGLFPLRAKDIKGAYTEETHKMALLGDVASWNYMEKTFLLDHIKYPNMKFILSECFTNGGCEAWFNFDHSFVIGMFYWGGTDYLGESTGPIVKGWDRGFVDIAGYNKPIANYLQATYKEDEPFVYITSSNTDASQRVWNDVKLSWEPQFEHWNYQANEQVNIICYTTLKHIEFYLNGKKIHDSSPTKNKIRFSTQYTEGVIMAIGVDDKGNIYTASLTTHKNPKKIKLIADRHVLSADSFDLAHITAFVVDENENICYLADSNIHFTVNGQCENIAVSSGDLMSNEPFYGSYRKVHNGKCLLVVRAKSNEGEIRIKAESDGIETAEIILRTVKNPIRIRKVGSGNGKIYSNETLLLDESTYSVQVEEANDIKIVTDSIVEGFICHDVFTKELPPIIDSNLDIILINE